MPTRSGSQRHERPRLAGQRVVQAERHRAGLRPTRRRSAEIDRPAPSAPSRLPVEALTLTAARSSPSKPGDGRRASRRGAPASRGRAATIVRSTEAAASRPPRRAAGRPRAARRWRCRAASARPAGKRRPRSPSPAAPSSASRDRVERDIAVRMAVRGAAHRRSRPRQAPAARRARTDGCRGPMPGPRPAPAAPSTSAGDAARSAGSGHLEVAWIAGDDMDVDATGFQQGGLIGERLGAVGGEALRRPARSRSAPDALRASARRPARRGRRWLRPRVPVDPLEGLGDRHDRDGRAVAAPSPRRPRRRARATPADARASWTRTTRRRDRRRRAAVERREPGERPTPGAGSPPTTTVDDGRRQPRRAAARSRGAFRRGRRRRSGRPGRRPRRARPASRQAAAGRRSPSAACRCRPSGSTGRRRRRSTSAPPRGRALRSIEPRLGEDHPPGDRLEDAGDRHVQISVDVAGAALDDDHRPVVEEADALARPPCPPG